MNAPILSAFSGNVTAKVATPTLNRADLQALAMQIGGTKKSPTAQHDQTAFHQNDFRRVFRYAPSERNPN